MLKKVMEFFDRARSDKLENLLKEHEDEFNFKLGNYFFPAVVLATVGCLFFQQAFWFACITIGVLMFTTLLGQVHSFDDKTVYREFINICVKKEGIVFSIVMFVSYSIMSFFSIILCNYIINEFTGIIFLFFYFLTLAVSIGITSTAISSLARLIIPLVIKKANESK